MMEKEKFPETVDTNPGLADRIMDVESAKVGRKNKGTTSDDPEKASKFINPPKKPLGRRFVFEKLKNGGSVGSASKRADGCAQRGKTRGRMV